MRKRIKPKERERSFTYFAEIYERFLNNITTDMYILIEENETIKLLQTLLISSLSDFEYPKFPINEYNLFPPRFYSEEIIDEEGIPHVIEKIDDDSGYPFKLNNEEISIIADLMTVRWIGQQLVNGDLLLMTYSGTDFKGSSQANHISRLNALRVAYVEVADKHMFNYSKSEINEYGLKESTFGDCNVSSNKGSLLKRNFSFDRFSRRQM